MSDKLIILPDSDLIAEFAQILKTEDPQPDKLYVDGYIELPYLMARHAPKKIFNDLENGPVTPETTRKSGVRLFAAAISCQDNYNGEMALRHFHNNHDHAKKIFENVINVKSMCDIQEIKNNRDTIGTLFLLKNADALVNNNRLILSLRDQGIYIVSLTNAGKNRLADGSAVMHSDGITPEGREVVHVLKDNNILIDTALLHPSCFWKLMDLIETPCVVSHTGVKDRCNLPGNISLEQIRQIVDRGGLAGITFNPEMLTPGGEAGIEDIFIHIDTIVQKFGPDSAALGSGFCGFDKPAAGMEGLSCVGNLSGIMAKHGYQREAVEKIMGLNWLRIYEGLL
ncbi:MAG: membrane dipeptidase [Deltaproteobacteria bacterium]|nr:membrane dipeptidase [Deltaproteobacteria bacterium]